MSIALIQLKQLNTGSLGLFMLSIGSGNISGLLQPYFAASGYLGEHVVYSSGKNQTIQGTKSFVNSINIPYSGGSGSAISQNHFFDVLNNLSVSLGASYLTKTGFAENISGIKSFISSPLVPNPINSGDAASKRYVDNAITISGSNTGLYNTFYISKTGNQQASGTLRFVGSLMLTGTPAGGGSSSIIFRDQLETAATETLEIYPFARWLSIDSQSNGTNALWFDPTNTFIEDDSPSAGICITSGILYSGTTRSVNLNWRSKLLNGQWTAGTGFNISGQFAQTGIIGGTGINVLNNNNGTYTINNTSIISVTGSSGIALANIIGTGGTNVTRSGSSTILIGSENVSSLTSFIFNTGITSGVNFQSYLFPTAFNLKPVVKGDINHPFRNDILGWQFSGVSNTGFSLVFSTTVPFTGFEFMGHATSGSFNYYNLRYGQ